MLGNRLDRGRHFKARGYFLLPLIRQDSIVDSSAGNKYVPIPERNILPRENESANNRKMNELPISL